MTDPDPLGDALLALRCLAIAPKRIGGIWLRGGAGPLRERLLEQLRLWLPSELPVRPLPPTIDDDRLEGGIDVAASLAAGRAVERPGLLAECWSGLLLVHGAERLRPGLAARLAQARDVGGPALVLIDDGMDDERPSASLIDRVGPIVDLSQCRTTPPIFSGIGETCSPQAAEADILALAAVAARIGVDSPRALFFAVRSAEAAAAAAGRDSVEDEDIIAAARLLLAPRATRMPAETPDEPSPEPVEGNREDSVIPIEDVVVEAIRPNMIPDLIALLATGRARSRAAQARGRGARMRTRTHGRPVGARAGTPSGGVRLALIDTLRAAAPWQAVRGREDGRVLLRRDDLRVRRFEDRQTVLTVFAVDASGSAAFARLAEAKGAVELLLERAYARRAEVALIVFRGKGAELLLPPTRSLTRARRLLGDLPGGGGTPLAAGLDEARMLVESTRSKGRTAQLIILTDGRANVARDGTQDRVAAAADARTAARLIGTSGIRATVIDISARPQPEAASLASDMSARLIHLPRAGAEAVAAAAA